VKLAKIAQNEILVPKESLATPIKVNWFVTTHTASNRVVATGILNTQNSRDHAVKIVVRDLEPSEAYFYKCVIQDIISHLSCVFMAPMYLPFSLIELTLNYQILFLTNLSV
jgi:phosphodiesterase/alkaline phosphatase D-like protein